MAAGHLQSEPVDPGEYAGLVTSGHTRLADAVNSALSLESRFDLGYNAGHALCLAALRSTEKRGGDCIAYPFGNATLMKFSEV